MTLDQSLLQWIHVGWTSGVMDVVMPFVSRLENFIPLFALVVLGLAVRAGRRGRFTLLLLPFLITATDQISASVIKPWVGRPRPCREEAGLSWVQPRARCSGKGSFPSSHAANMAGVAVLLAVRHRRWGWAFVPGALLVGLSRVYLGVHYPSDVVAGWALGAGLGYGALLAGEWIDRRWGSGPRAGGRVDEAVPPVYP